MDGPALPVDVVGRNLPAIGDIVNPPGMTDPQKVVAPHIAGIIPAEIHAFNDDNIPCVDFHRRNPLSNNLQKAESKAEQKAAEQKDIPGPEGQKGAEGQDGQKAAERPT